MSNHETLARREFVALLRSVDATVLDGDELGVLVDDLVETAAELWGRTPAAVWAIWLDRLGGQRNIRPYVETLKAGRARNRRIAR